MILAFVVFAALFQDAVRLEELTRSLDADDAAARTKAQAELEAFLDTEAKARWVRERMKTAEVETRGRLRKALERWDDRGADQIAFVREGRLWMMNDRGRNARALPPIGENEGPAFSPDGKKIAFASLRDDSSQIYLIDADGKNEVQLTRGKVDAYDPTFSPDGTRIAYSVDGAGKGIRSVDLDGRNPAVLSEWGEWPSYRPDGKSLLLTGRDRTAQGNVFLRALGDKGEPLLITELFKPKPLNFHARFSPDGKRIVFAGWTPGGGGSLYVVNADGKELTAVKREGRFFAWSSFSPDGNRILCVRSSEDLRGIRDRHFLIDKPEIVVLEEGKPDVVLGEGTYPAWRPRLK